MSKPISVDERRALALGELQEKRLREQAEIALAAEQFPRVFEMMITTGMAEWTGDWRLRRLSVPVPADLDIDLYDLDHVREALRIFLNQQLATDERKHLGYTTVRYVLVYEKGMNQHAHFLICFD